MPSLRLATSIALGVWLGAVMCPPKALGSTPPCGAPGRPWILVKFAGDRLGDQVIGEVMAQVRAGLSKRGIDACPPPAPASDPTAGEAGSRAAPVATLVFSPTDRNGVALSLEVRDALTAKRVSRDIDLATTPSDGRALILAVEADELLRATWAELAMGDKPSTGVEVPAAVTRAVAASMGGGRGQVFAQGSVGVGAGVEAFQGGITLYGGDVRTETWFAPHWGAAFSIGYRRSAMVDVAIGNVSAEAFHVAVAGLAALTPRDRRAGLELGVSVNAFALSLEPNATSNALAAPKTDVAVLGSAMLTAWLVLAPPVRVFLGGGAAAPFRAVTVTADNRTMESTTGAAFVGSFAVSMDY